MAYLQRAGIGNLVHDALDERRLAFAVFAHKGHFLAALDGERGVVKHLMVAIGLAYIVQL